jgi:hypothetical protein
MNSIEGRINGQAAYNPANKSSKAWRDEMLDHFLNQMRERQPEPEPITKETIKTAFKGQYVDLYV